PLLDHFHPPLFPRRHWESFHTSWAGTIADALNEDLLPEGYFAEEHTHMGPRIEIDVATFDEAEAASGRGVATAPARVWTPPAPNAVLEGAFPDSFEVLVFESEGGARLVAAIELVSPANKDRAGHRRAFAIKCASYLVRGIGLIVVDVVTSRQANLHDEVLELLRQAAPVAGATGLYAAAYRPIVREGKEQIEVWTSALAVGQALPVLPLSLSAELCLPIDLEATYTTACQSRRLSG
ncbi:MAG: DUF4058 family protein, partial [Gemmataceae bacterium]